MRSRLAFIIAIIFVVSLTLSAAADESQPQAIGGCPMFPADNIWNRRVDDLPLHSNSANYIASIGTSGALKADFGAGLWNGGPIGIPYTTVTAGQPGVPITFDYDDESDPGPYPIPTNAPIEGGPNSSGDRHVLIVQTGTCKLYETFSSYPQSNGSWQAGSGATWNLNSNALRPAGWTSADAAGLPILPGLVRYDEVAVGAINHPIRFTVDLSQRAYVWPARHLAASSTDPNRPPMGLHLRLKANVNISSYSPANQVILTALKRYGMIVADNGSNWFMSGAPDERWNNDDLQRLRNIHGSDFEVVETAGLMIDPNSGQARQAGSPTPTPLPPSPSPTLAAFEFYDVPPGSLWYTYVHYLAQQGIVAGSGGYYRPNNPTTRGEFAKMSVLSFGIAAYTPPVPTFSDVPSTHPFYRYVEAAAHAGVITGYGDGRFYPGNQISRAQVAVIVRRAKGWPEATPAAATFRDLPVGSFGYGAVEALVGRGIITGAACSSGGGTCFRPNDNIRRGEISKVLYLAIAPQ